MLLVISIAHGSYQCSAPQPAWTLYCSLGMITSLVCGGKACDHIKVTCAALRHLSFSCGRIWRPCCFQTRCRLPCNTLLTAALFAELPMWCSY